MKLTTDYTWLINELRALRESNEKIAAAVIASTLVSRPGFSERIDKEFAKALKQVKEAK